MQHRATACTHSAVAPRGVRARARARVGARVGVGVRVRVGVRGLAG